MQFTIYIQLSPKENLVFTKSEKHDMNNVYRKLPIDSNTFARFLYHLHFNLRGRFFGEFFPLSIIRIKKKNRIC